MTYCASSWRSLVNTTYLLLLRYNGILIVQCPKIWIFFVERMEWRSWKCETKRLRSCCYMLLDVMDWFKFSGFLLVVCCLLMCWRINSKFFFMWLCACHLLARLRLIYAASRSIVHVRIWEVVVLADTAPNSVIWWGFFKADINLNMNIWDDSASDQTNVSL